MYKSRALISGRGQIRILVRFKIKNDIPRNKHIAGMRGLEVGESQSVNVRKYWKQMINDAVLHALYKFFYGKGGYLATGEDINDYVEKVDLIEYSFSYYESPFSKYKRQNIKNSYYYIKTLNGQVTVKEKPKFISKRQLEHAQENIY